MKNIFFLLSIALITNLSYAQTSSNSTDAIIVHAIPSPTSSTHDIAFDGENIWQVSSKNIIYKISPSDGSVLKRLSIDTDLSTGLTFDGTSLWVSDRTNQLLVQIDTLDGEILQQLQLNNDGATGLAWDGSNIWHNNDDQSDSGDTTFHISSQSGDILDFFIPEGAQPGGLAFDGQFLWSTDRLSDQIYKIDPSTFSAVDSIEAPGGQYPNGLAFDGQYLWVANNDVDSIYQIDIEYIITGTNDRLVNSIPSSVYPNPSTGRFVFSSDHQEDLFISVFDTRGETILNEPLIKGNKTIINLENSDSKLFTYTLSNKKGILKSGKLMKE